MQKHCNLFSLNVKALKKIETNLMDNYTTTYSMYTFLWQTPNKKNELKIKQKTYLWNKPEIIINLDNICYRTI